MKRYLVTGANRGLGLEFTRQLLERGESVVATCRQPIQAVELKNLHGPDLTVKQLDVAEARAIADFPTELEREGLGVDVLINNAGMAEPGEKLGALEADAMARVFLVNSISPILMSQALAPWLQKSSSEPKIFCLSSRLGSVSLASDSGYGFSYPMSKAALNMGVKQLSFRLTRIPVVALHPGWVQTDMGSSRAPLEPAESIRGLLKVIDAVSLKDTGRYLTFEGEELPW
jgi:NAD(P)-dependent dehydrogenase (short-subunit alcohol dehydrogenase family)